MLGLALELGLEVVEESVIEIFATQMRVTGSCLDGEDATSDGKKGDIESA